MIDNEKNNAIVNLSKIVFKKGERTVDLYCNIESIAGLYRKCGGI